MTQIHIRNVPPELHNALKRQAAAAGMSFNEYLLKELRDIGQRPSLAEFTSRARRRPLFQFDKSSADVLREKRERG